MSERWLPVVGYEGRYDISSHGRVRSLDRTDDGERSWRGRMMRQSYLRNHAMVGLSSFGKNQIHYVHRMVLTAFIGPCPQGMEGCHNDGDPHNNKLVNLRWDTPASNSQDRVRHGKDAHASQTHCKRGHVFDAENTYQEAPRKRGCRKCRKAASDRAHARQKEERMQGRKTAA